MSQHRPQQKSPGGGNHTGGSNGKQFTTIVKPPTSPVLSTKNGQLAMGELSTHRAVAAPCETNHVIQGSDMSNGRPPNTGAFFKVAKLVSPWFAAIVALVYGTGFLCVSTFLDRFGIRETGDEFFRIKYIHVGVLFILFPLCVLVPFGVILSLKKAERKENTGREMNERDAAATDFDASGHQEKKFRVPVSGMVSFFNMCGVFYLFILFAPRDFAVTREFVFPMIILSSLLGPLVIDFAVGRYIVPHRSESIRRFWRWALLFFVVGVLDYYAFKGFWKQLLVVLWGEGWVPDGAIYYIVLMALVPYVFWRTNVQSRKAPTPRAKRELRIAASCLAFTLYFFAIIAFGLRVYPRIPVAKGGGNYVDAPSVSLKFQPVPGVSPIVETVNSVQQELSSSNGFVVIAQTQHSLFLARRRDEGGPVEWQKMRHPPNIIEVRRDTIGEVLYTQTQYGSNSP